MCIGRAWHRLGTALCARPRRVVTCAGLGVLALILLGGARSAAAGSGQDLIAELGCGACHADLVAPGALRAELPDLGGAGQRYRVEYLFAYLQAPSRRRRHLGAARMPDFSLYEAEAVALARFLAGERRDASGTWPALPAESAERMERGAELLDLLAEHSCLACHEMEGRGGGFGPPLDGVGARLQPEWLRRFLIAPDRFGIPDGRMPALFLRPDEATGDWQETVPGASADLRRIVDGLVRAGAAAQRELMSAWEAAQERHPTADASVGRAIFIALNCAGCHAHPEIEPWRDRAPSLAAEGSRVQAEWLSGYLAAPEPLRVLGTPPGSGSRMPDFRLTPAEVASLTHELMSRRSPAFFAEAGRAISARGPLSAFSREKASRLLAEQLPCLGCHRLRGDGGRIGPDLGGLSRRLRPEFIAAVVRAPSAVMPHTAMPEVPMAERQRELVVSYLQQNTEPRQPVAYPSLVATPPLDFPEQPPGRALYARLCAACHGAAGGGDGPNAPYLPVRPTAHADAAVLSSRPDDVLYDGIAAGGAILGKSQRMPPWGQTLEHEAIASLVRELRALCRCEGPEWSRGDTAVPAESAS